MSDSAVFGQDVTAKILGLLDPEDKMTLDDHDSCSPTLKGKNNASLHVTAAITDLVALPESRDFSDFIGLPSSSYITVQGCFLPATSLYRVLFLQLRHCTVLSASSYSTVQGCLLPATSL